METIRQLESLGIRLAGTKEEKAAADWIESRFQEAGLVNVHQQEFPCLTFGHRRCHLSVRDSKGEWKQIRSEPAAHSPSTQAPLEEELRFIEKIPRSGSEARLLKDRVVLAYCSVLFERRKFRRVMESRPAALLLVDDRLPCDWTVAVGFPRYWIDFITCPVVNVSFTDAWNLVSGGYDRARLELDAFVRESTSQNVIGEITGTSDESVVVSGHHDSVVNNPGADDNLTGVAATLELARVFSGSEPWRTIRFISYGTEEQLSEGARHYASSIRNPDRIQLVLNTDAIGAWMGQTQIFCTGTRSLRTLISRVNRETDFPGHVLGELSPFSDHFPLNLRGVPSVWYYRPTFTAARHFHHSERENIGVISPTVLERTIRSQAVLLDRVANQDPLPFTREIGQSQRMRLKQMGRDWIGVEEL